MHSIEVPKEVAQSLAAAAAANGLPLADYIALLVNTNQSTGTEARQMSRSRITYEWEDHDFIGEAISEAGSVEPDIEATRKALSKIPGPVAEEFTTLRDERI